MFGEFLRVLFTVLIVMDPIGIVPQFLSITAGYDKDKRNRILIKALLVAGLVLLVFVFAGRVLLNFFGIMPGSFYISGGILFFLIAFEMIYSKPGSRSVPSENSNISPAIFPLAIPLVAGPGLLTVLIMFTTGGDSWLYSCLLTIPAIIISLTVAFIVLKFSTVLLTLLGEMGIFIMEKIMGLILSGFAVQLVYNGLKELGIIGK
jgi:multiple antibiotic resistance protein